MICSLLPGIVVHHKDFNPYNNDINNLEPMTRSEHARLHSLRLRHTEETKTKLSVSHMDKPGHPQSEYTRQRLREYNVGRLLTIEHKLKLSESHKGKYFSRKVEPTQEMLDDTSLLSRIIQWFCR
jgi:hypothetical protein